MQCGAFGEPQLSRKLSPHLRPPKPTPYFSWPSAKESGKEGESEVQRGRKGKRKREGEKKEQRGGHWPAGERKRRATSGTGKPVGSFLSSTAIGPGPAPEGGAQWGLLVFPKFRGDLRVLLPVTYMASAGNLSSSPRGTS